MQKTWKVGEQVTGKGDWKKVGPYDERRVERGSETLLKKEVMGRTGKWLILLSRKKWRKI